MQFIQRVKAYCVKDPNSDCITNDATMDLIIFI